MASLASAAIHGLRCNPPMSWMLSSLRSALKRGPLMFDMLWNVNEYLAGSGSPGHMICVIGIRGDNESGKVLRFVCMIPGPQMSASECPSMH